MNKFLLRCDDLFVDVDAELCRRVWSAVDEVGVKQVLGVVPRGIGEPFWREGVRILEMGDEWVRRETGDRHIGENVELVKLIRERVRKGDEVGLHGYYHVNFTKMDLNQQIEAINLGIECIHKLFGVKPRFFLAPYNSIGEWVVRAATECDLLILRSGISGDGGKPVEEQSRLLREKVKRYPRHHLAPLSYHIQQMAHPERLRFMIELAKVLKTL